MQSPAYAFDGTTADGHFQGHNVPQPSGLHLLSDEEKSSGATPFLWLAIVCVVALLIVCPMWWWQRGSNVHFKITPPNATVTLDGAPLAVVNGEATVPALKRGVHMVVVVPPQGGLLRQSVDVSFLESTQNVDIKVPGSRQGLAAKARR
jgi:hypothetical protein